MEKTRPCVEYPAVAKGLSLQFFSFTVFRAGEERKTNMANVHRIVKIRERTEYNRRTTTPRRALMVRYSGEGRGKSTLDENNSRTKY